MKPYGEVIRYRNRPHSADKCGICAGYEDTKGGRKGLRQSRDTSHYLKARARQCSRQLCKEEMDQMNKQADYWSYRILRTPTEDGKYYTYGIHEVYFDGHTGERITHSSEPITIKNICLSSVTEKEEEDTIKDMKESLLFMLKAFNHPVLDYDEDNKD